MYLVSLKPSLFAVFREIARPVPSLPSHFVALFVSLSISFCPSSPLRHFHHRLHSLIITPWRYNGSTTTWRTVIDTYTYCIYSVYVVPLLLIPRVPTRVVRAFRPHLIPPSLRTLFAFPSALFDMKIRITRESTTRFLLCFFYVSFSLILSRRLSEYIRYYNMQWIHCLLKRPASAFDDLVALLLLCAMTTAIASDPISSTLCVCVCVCVLTPETVKSENARRACQKVRRSPRVRPQRTTCTPA